MRGAVIGFLQRRIARRQFAARLTMNAPFPQRQRPITIAILAMGGEGGGVLADWIIDLAESNRYIAQLTSVPGVAQRTGATIYYIEIYPRARHRRCRRRAGARADAGAGRRRHRDRVRTDGSRPRDPARLGHARPHHADRLDQPRVLDDREDRDGRRPRRRREADRGLPRRGATPCMPSTWRRSPKRPAA